MRPYVEDDLVDNTSSLRTWWRHYSPFVEAVGGAGVQVSLRLVRPAGAPGDPGVDELLALWEAEGSAVEAVRDIWFGRQEVLRLEGGHPRVVEAYGGRRGSPSGSGPSRPAWRSGGRGRAQGGGFGDLAGGGAAFVMVARLLMAGTATMWWIWSHPLSLDDRFLVFIREQTPLW